ncbi:hypothetical protein BOX37_31990 [Nocardia mangyaensis]|uniref:Uncharacterized protein n=1 Tax=Nocardia mangyaensis TaxID=2213200 RepID=A0A1J0W0J7_9NOCA|nr:hypothetical protein [Nocardia mangyaensis]APE37789.1 hypothetical protein BOX37_31990 [Nocardia mangyaensis]
MCALVLSCAAIATYVGFALVLDGLEKSVNAGGRTSGIGMVIAAVLSAPAVAMGGGAILSKEWTGGGSGRSSPRLHRP